jgi:casein kinase 1
MELTVGKIFKLTRKLGQGAFGEIYHAINTKNDSEVAVKLEPVKSTHPQLFYEAKLLAFLNNNDSSLNLGIPQVM